MRALKFAIPFLILSCNSGKSDKKTDKPPDTSIRTATTTVTKPAIKKDSTVFYTAPGEQSVNKALEKKYGTKWQVLNDARASWMKDAFEYFIVPKRKEFPDYPYITRGDFNGDGKQDTAAVITDSLKTKYQIAVISAGGKITLWDEDIMADAALSTAPKSVIEIPYGETTRKFKLKAESINVEYYERASFILYWEKSSLKRIQTGD